MVINTNQNAIDASSALQRGQMALNRSMARLNARSKSDNASDEAAGMTSVKKSQAQNSRVGTASADLQLQIEKENLLAANSRIKNVVVAKEVTRFAKGEVLTQGAAQMLHKANGLPQTVLRLLG